MVGLLGQQPPVGIQRRPCISIEWMEQNDRSENRTLSAACKRVPEKSTLCMRVLLVLEYPSLNGGENSLLSLVPVLQDQGAELIAAAPPYDPLGPALVAAGVALVPWDGRARAGSQSARRQALERIIGQVGPDLVHANSLSMARLAGPVCQSRSIPGLGFLRDILRLSRAALTDLARQSRLIAVSRATRDWYVSLGLPADRVHVLYNGVDLDRFAPRAPTGYLHRELRLGPEAQWIASIGQLGMRKGTDLLLQALQHVLPRHSQVHCLVIGQRHSEKAESRQYERELYRLAQAPPLAGRVHFLGRRNDIPHLLNELSLLVHLARQEPLGRVLLEAAASGCCVVATRVGGTEEIFPPESSAACLINAERPEEAAVRQGRNPAGCFRTQVRAAPVGRSVSRRENDSFTVRSAEAIDRLLRDPATRQAMGAAARQRAESTFGNISAAKALFRHYLELTGWLKTTQSDGQSAPNCSTKGDAKTIDGPRNSLS